MRPGAFVSVGPGGRSTYATTAPRRCPIPRRHTPSPPPTQPGETLVDPRSTPGGSPWSTLSRTPRPAEPSTDRPGVDRCPDLPDRLVTSRGGQSARPTYRPPQMPEGELPWVAVSLVQVLAVPLVPLPLLPSMQVPPLPVAELRRRVSPADVLSR